MFQNTNFRFQFSTKLEMLVEAVSPRGGCENIQYNRICLFLNPSYLPSLNKTGLPKICWKFYNFRNDFFKKYWNKFVIFRISKYCQVHFSVLKKKKFNKKKFLIYYHLLLLTWQRILCCFNQSYKFLQKFKFAQKIIFFFRSFFRLKTKNNTKNYFQPCEYE